MQKYKVTVNFLNYYNVQISINYEKIILKIAMLPIGLVRSGIIFPVVSETTRTKR